MANGESLEVMVGRIDERTATIQEDVTAIKKDIGDLYQRGDDLKSRLDKLQTEHNDRKSTGDCAVTVQSGNPVNIAAGLPKNALAVIGGVSGGVSLILLIAFLLVLKAMGFTF